MPPHRPTRAIRPTAVGPATRMGRYLVAPAVLTVLALTLTGCAGTGSDKADDKGPVATAPSTPPSTPEQTPTTTPEGLLTGEALTKSFEIPTGLTDEQLGTYFIKGNTETKQGGYSNWGDYGVNDKSTINQWISSGNQVDAYLQNLATSYGDAIADGMLVKDWRNNPNLNSFVDDHAIAGNLAVLKANAATSGGTLSEDKQAYDHWLTIGSVETISSDDASRTIKEDVIFHDNAALNRVGDPSTSLYVPNDIRDGDTFSMTETFVKQDDGTERVSNVVFGPINYNQ